MYRRRMPQDDGYIAPRRDYAFSAEVLVFWFSNTLRTSNAVIRPLARPSWSSRTKQNVGKTWKQSFSLPSSAYSLGRELKFTMTAIELETKQYGRMVAVRALSEPFIVKVISAKEGVKDVRSKTCALYLFDSEINDIYLSISVFESATNINSPKETFRHEVATYKTGLTPIYVPIVIRELSMFFVMQSARRSVAEPGGLQLAAKAAGVI